MKKLVSLIFFIFTILLTSCGRTGEVSRGIASIDPGDYLTLDSRLTTDESSLATNICRAFRTKRLRIQARIFDPSAAVVSEIGFKVEKGECNDTDPDKEQKITVKEAFFSPSLDDKGIPKYNYIRGEGSTLFSTDIDTDENGHLKEVCDVLLDDENKNEPVVINYPSVNEVKTITFEAPNTFYIAYGEKVEVKVDDETVERYKLIQKSKFKLNMDNTKKYYGFIDSIVKETGCLNDNFSKTTQVMSLPDEPFK